MDALAVCPCVCWQIFTFAALEQDAVPVILHPRARQSLRVPRHCLAPAQLPVESLAHIKQVSALGWLA